MGKCQLQPLQLTIAPPSATHSLTLTRSITVWQSVLGSLCGRQLCLRSRCLWWARQVPGGPEVSEEVIMVEKKGRKQVSNKKHLPHSLLPFYRKLISKKISTISDNNANWSHQDACYTAIMAELATDEPKCLAKLFCGSGKSRIIFRRWNNYNNECLT